jgi:ElaB/YqjD/DUF883 family membrane-anchored ribosome-binding protein
MSVSSLFSDEVPPDALALIEQAEHDLDAIQADADDEVARTEARAEEAIDQIRARTSETTRTVRERANNALVARTEQLLQALRPIQVAHVKEGRLDEALAIRERARQFRGRLLNARPDPGNLAEYTAEQAGTELVFEVTGSTEGAVWGTDVYTSDSRLASAVVHAGVLRDGERGLVRVTLLDGRNVAFNGMHRNGVWSDDYGDYPMAYRVRRA